MRFIKPIVIVEGMETFCGRQRLSRRGMTLLPRRAEPLPVPLPPLWADLSLNWLPCLYTVLLLVSQPSNFSRSPSESVSLWPINRKCFNLSWVLTLWCSLYSYYYANEMDFKIFEKWLVSLTPTFHERFFSAASICRGTVMKSACNRIQNDGPLLT